MYRIFISYSSKSKSIVGKLAEDLGITGHEIWFDHQLTGGQSWWDTILSEIRQCDIFIFALTSEALESYACKLEYTYAHKLGKPVLPVKMDENVPIHQLPDELQLIQFVDYTTQDTQAAFRLVSALNSLPSAPVLPDPLPEPPPVPLSYVGKLREQIDRQQLTFDEQASIVFKLKERLQDGDSTEEARGLLERLRRRDDLYAKIDREIQDVLEANRPISARLFTRRERENHAEEAAEPKAAPVATPKRERKQAAAQAAPAAQSAQAAGAKGSWLPLVIGSAAIWGIGFGIGIGSITLALFLLLTAISYGLHGIYTARYFRGLQPPPRADMTSGWLLRSALMGGPLNGLLLRRVSTRVRWWHVVLVVIGWLLVAAGGLTLANSFYSANGSTMASGIIWGTVSGAGGALVTYLAYQNVRA
ncbi:MAG: toll/interleukin-1 receptor domain-containing protein [Anaerolineae bacterium]|nr:toll/interleukin-1 receptor domain-containing protein [Anaerolineae bacterium]